MDKFSPTDQKCSLRHTPQDQHREEAIASIWLVFYLLAIGVAISSPFVAAQIIAAAH